MTYEEILASSPAKQRFYDLFNQFPLTVRNHIMTRYSGIFNFFDEVSDNDVNVISDRMEQALFKQHEFLMTLYGDIL